MEKGEAMHRILPNLETRGWPGEATVTKDVKESLAKATAVIVIYVLMMRNNASTTKQRQTKVLASPSFPFAARLD